MSMLKVKLAKVKWKCLSGKFVGKIHTSSITSTYCLAQVSTIINQVISHVHDPGLYVKVKVTRQGQKENLLCQKENLFRKHNFNMLRPITTCVLLGRSVHHDKAICHVYDPGLHFKGQGYRSRSMRQCYD